MELIAPQYQQGRDFRIHNVCSPEQSILASILLHLTPSSAKQLAPGLQEGPSELDGKMDDWIEQFSQQTSEELQEQQQQRRAMSAQAGLPTSQDYIMAEDNPFMEVSSALVCIA